VTTTFMSKLVLKFFPEQEKPAAPAVRKSSIDAEIAVAIAAVKAHTQS
jgi:oxaloacetate decarboxylase (Na+ extruding) subunit gamma